MGFEAEMPLEEGLRRTVESFREQGAGVASSEAPRALITGITGQDGSYLAEFLLDRATRCWGIVRRSPTRTIQNLAPSRTASRSCRATCSTR